MTWEGPLVSGFREGPSRPRLWDFTRLRGAWWGRRDLNPHDRSRAILSRLRIPFRHAPNRPVISCWHDEGNASRLCPIGQEALSIFCA